MIEYSKIKKINENLKMTDIKGKDYATVNQRVLAFRELCPDGTISTEIVSRETNSNSTHDVIIKATITDGEKVISTGMAWENSASSNVNRTSYIENCETSAVGRALGFLGIGAVDSIATLEELANAVTQQTAKPKTSKAPTSATNAPTSAPKAQILNYICERCGGEIEGVKLKNGKVLTVAELIDFGKGKFPQFEHGLCARCQTELLKNGGN